MSSLKSTKQILKEMGFNPDSKDSTQLAFYRHLKKAAAETEKKELKETREPEQLEFDFDGPMSGSASIPAKKISNR